MFAGIFLVPLQLQQDEISINTRNGPEFKIEETSCAICAHNMNPHRQTIGQEHFGRPSAGKLKQQCADSTFLDACAHVRFPPSSGE